MGVRMDKFCKEDIVLTGYLTGDRRSSMARCERFPKFTIW